MIPSAFWVQRDIYMLVSTWYTLTSILKKQGCIRTLRLVTFPKYQCPDCSLQ